MRRDGRTRAFNWSRLYTLDMTIRLMHYDPRWKQEFQQTRSGILQSCLGWVTSVEHIGSTAISGLIARPIIDVVAVVSAADLAPGKSESGKASGNDDSVDGVAEQSAMSQSADLIEGLNFRRTPAPEWADDAIVLEKPRHGEPTHRVFLTTRESRVWRETIAIRDHLRESPEVAIRFEETKIARWRSGGGDQERYHADKGIFFAHLIDQIQH